MKVIILYHNCSIRFVLSNAIINNIFIFLGVPAMAGSAIVGGVLLALIEGIGIMFSRMTAEQFKPQAPVFEDPTALGSPGLSNSN